jgi:ribosomal protein S18 acetylase RimI-like enzyme
MLVTIRPAQATDVQAIAEVHVAAWRESYRGILSDETIERLTVPARAEYWTHAVSDPTIHVFVAEADGRVVGFGSSGATRQQLLATAGEVYAVYVLKRFQYRGVGSRLMAAMARSLVEAGHGTLGLWVARDNLAAIAFYRTLGASTGAARSHARGGGLPLIELAMLWDDAAELTLWDEPASRPLPARMLPEHDVQSPWVAAHKAGRGACRPA